MIDWQAERGRIPACSKYAYLMSAAAGPLHPEALRASIEFQKQLHEHGDRDWEKNVERIDEIRSRAAQLLRVQADEICFVSSSSLAFSLAAALYRNRGYKNFFSFREEFPTSTLPFINAGFRAHFIESSEASYSIESYMEAVASSSEKSLFVLSHVESLTGFRHPIEALSKLLKEQNIPFVVNATQSFGAMGIDASELSVMCASIHKWLMSGFGLSILKFDRSLLGSDLPVYGWLSQKNPWQFYEHRLDPLFEARVFELGCPELVQIFSLGAVLDWVDQLGGFEQIWKRILHLRRYFDDRATSLGLRVDLKFEEDKRSSLVFLKHSQAEKVERALKEKDILVSARGDYIRVALHWFNNEEDIDRLLKEFQSLANQS